MHWRGAAIACLLLAGTSQAHVPGFGAGGTSQEDAYHVDDPTKSWVFFGEMSAGQRWFRIALDAGDELFLSLSLPAKETARPTLWLVEEGQSFPGRAVPAMEDLGIEPFTPVALRTVAELREPVDRSVVLYAVVESDTATSYGLAVGGRESFTPVEWIRVPVDRIAIQSWAGIPALAAVAGELIALTAVVTRFRSNDPRIMIGRTGAAMVIGSAGTTLLLVSIAIVQAGLALGVVIPVVLAAAAIALGLVAYRAVNAQRAWWIALLCATGALVLWAGLLAGPILLAIYAGWTAVRRAAASE